MILLLRWAYLADISLSTVSCLKALRLSNPRFARLNIIQKHLFGAVRLVATPEHVDRLARTDLGRLSPWMKTVTLVAPSQSWALTFEGFREVIIDQAVQRHASDHGIWNGSSYHRGEEANQKYIERYWEGKFPIPDDQIQAGFEKYHKDALAAKELLYSTKLRSTWANAFRHLQAVYRLRFKSYDPVTYQDPLRVQPDSVARCHYNGKNYQFDTRGRIAAPVGDALFAAGVACLADANVKLKQLDVDCDMTGIFGWGTLPKWEDLDLSQIQIFNFQPEFKSDKEYLDAFGGEDTTAERAAEAIATVLKKCKNDLQKFKYGYSGYMQWPGDEVIELPNLRFLSLGNDCIRSQNLKSWMAKMPLLEHLELLGTRLFNEDHTGYLNVFDAIREHPIRIMLIFEEFPFNNHSEIYLSYHTGDFQRLLEQDEDEDSDVEIYRSLSLYLSGKIEYPECLRHWLEDE